MRTDVHAPKNFKPEDYEFVGCGNYPTAEMDASPVPIEHLLRDGWRFGGSSGGGCDHCGAFLIYYAVLKHIPSHTLIKVGETCLDNRFDLANAEFQALRKAGKLNRERRQLSEKRDAFLMENDHSELFYWAKDQPWADRRTDDESFEAKFVRYIERYGEASERFVDAIRRSKARATEWAAKKAEEANTASPVIEGKVVVTGEILSVKWRDNAYGGSLKMIVKDDRGFKIWGTVASSIGFEPDALVNQRVSFTATVKKSDEDETFGFFSRPTKANLI